MQAAQRETLRCITFSNVKTAAWKTGQARYLAVTAIPDFNTNARVVSRLLQVETHRAKGADNR
jgi:ribosomal protein S17E